MFNTNNMYCPWSFPKFDFLKTHLSIYKNMILKNSRLNIDSATPFSLSSNKKTLCYLFPN